MTSFHVNEWEKMRYFVGNMDENDINKLYFHLMLNIHDRKTEKAMELLNVIKKDNKTNPSYISYVEEQKWMQLEEIIVALNETRDDIYQNMDNRLNRYKNDFVIWKHLLPIQSLIREPKQNVDNWLHFSTLCCENGNYCSALNALSKITMNNADDIISQIMSKNYDKIMNACDVNVSVFKILDGFAEYCWYSGFEDEAIGFISYIVDNDQLFNDEEKEKASKIKCNALVKLGNWKKLQNKNVDPEVCSKIIDHFERATTLDESTSAVWSNLAMSHCDMIRYCKNNQDKKHESVKRYINSAIHALVKCIGMGATYKDILKLFHLCLNNTEYEETFNVKLLMSTIDDIPMYIWLQLVEQIISGLRQTLVNKNHILQQWLQKICIKLGNIFPHDVIFKMINALKLKVKDSIQEEKKLDDIDDDDQKGDNDYNNAIHYILKQLRPNHSSFMDECTLISTELIRIAAPRELMWYTAMEEASRLYFGDKNVDGTVKLLEPLFMVLNDDTSTLYEEQFKLQHASDLLEAYDWMKRYKKTKNESDLNQMWDIIRRVFRAINSTLSNKTIELALISPKLVEYNKREIHNLPVFGLSCDILIDRINSNIVLNRTQHIAFEVLGSNGKEYKYMMKHDQCHSGSSWSKDEAMMRFLDLVNNLIHTNEQTKYIESVMIRKENILTLSCSVFMVQTVQNCHTLHQLIKEYRQNHTIRVNIENRQAFIACADYSDLPIMNQSEIFENVLRTTEERRNDLSNMLWLKSTNSQHWFRKRINFTNSAAVMSIIGVIIGLGDRHPDNILMDDHDGSIMHLMYGECFEYAQQRDKFPEKVPFRLTRMMVNTMGVEGIHGNFKYICQIIMKTTVQKNKEIIHDVLETLINDPFVKLGDKTKRVSILKRIKQVLNVETSINDLILEATNSDNLCQMYLGWCPWW